MKTAPREPRLARLQPTVLPGRKTHFLRSRLLFVAMALAFLALGVRTAYLQMVSQPYLAKQGERAYERTLTLPATRGSIVDRNGVMLAASLPASAVAVQPQELELSDPRVAELLRILQLDPIATAIRVRRAAESRSQFLYLARLVDLDTTDRIRALDVPGVILQPQYQRVYPQGPIIAQLVGFTGVEHEGLDGMELAYNRFLTGQPGSRRVARDGVGRIIGAVDTVQSPRNGDELRLSIDMRIQSQAFQAIREVGERTRARSASAVVLDTQTGQILAMANWPSYDPVDRSGLSSTQVRNRAITDLFEPGSTIKPFTVAMALESGRYRPGSLIDVRSGRLTIGRRTIHDAHREEKPLTVSQVIQRSSNIGTATMALALPPESLGRMLHAVGFGQSPRIGFPGAAAGVLRPAESWKPIEHATISYGHGMSASLLQIAHAYTVLANDGLVRPLTLLREAPEESPVLPGGAMQVSLRAAARPSAAGEQVIDRRVAAQVRAMLESVTGEKGTAPEARVPGYRVGGKTGTAKKIEDGRYVSKYVSSFVGIAPLSRPRLVVAVMVDEPQGRAQYGGSVAGPVFSSITGEALRVLHVEPDAPLESIIAPRTALKEPS